MNILESILKAEEHCVLHTYPDSRGIPTCGWGHRVWPGEKVPNPMTQVQADQLLLSDIDHTEDAVWQSLPWLDMLSSNRQAILGSMAFQMGIDGLLKFEDFLEFLQKQKWQSAHDAMLDSAWAKETPNRAQRHAQVILTNTLPAYYNIKTP